MKCKDCGALLNDLHGLKLSCVRCGKLTSDCTCGAHNPTPDRRVHCDNCDRVDAAVIDTTQDGWRSQEV